MSLSNKVNVSKHTVKHAAPLYFLVPQVSNIILQVHEDNKKTVSIIAKSKVGAFLYLAVVMSRLVCALSAVRSSVGVPVFFGPCFYALDFQNLPKIPALSF